MKCCHCDAELAPNAKFCRHCGKEIVTFCTECGQPLEKDARFCTKCGTEVQKIESEEKKTPDILPSIGEIAVDVAEKVLEKVESDNHSTHWEEVQNAKPAQVETPARSENPAKPQSTTHTDGSAGGAGQKIRRSSTSVRDAAARQTESVSGEAPVEAPKTPETVREPAPVHTAAEAAAPAQPSAYTPGESAQASQTGAQQSPATARKSAPAPMQAPAAQQNAPAYEPAPAQTQPVQSVPMQTPVSHTQPVTPHIPVAPDLARKSAGIGTTIIEETARGAIKGASGAGKAAKTVAIWAAVVAFVIGAASACLNFFVPAPEDTVDKLIESVEELKYDDMLSCFDSTTEKQIRAVMGITGDLFGSLTGISMDLEDLMAFAPSLAPYMEIPDLGIASAETVLYADCSENKLMTYCETANAGGSIPTGYLSDNEIVSFLMEYNVSLPGLENLIAEVAVVKITLKTGEVGYLPLINEGWGDWRIPMMDLMNAEGMG